MRYNLVRGVDIATITVYHNGEMYTADEKHPAFKDIVSKCLADDATAIDYFDVTKAVSKKFERLSNNVTARHGHIYYDGDEVHDVIVDHIFRAMEEGTKFDPLVKFLDNLHANPNKHSVEHLYRWLHSTKGFTINARGNIIGYKGVNKKLNPNGVPTDEYLSCHAGYAIVDGVEVNGNVPNKVGSVIEMPRSKVTFDPKQGCSYGLHVGVWDYAKSWGTVVLNVEVNPRDVVSVPSDSSDQKMRVCRYKVLSVNTTGKLLSTVA